MDRAIIFDLDDTLFDHAAAMARFLVGQHGLAPETAARLVAEDRRGRRNREKFCALVAEACGAEATEVWHSVRHEFGRYAELESEHVLEVVSGHARLAVLTNGGSTTQRTKLDALAVSRWIPESHWFISGELGVEKPNPASFQSVLSTLDLPPQQVLFVGDDLVCDIAGAAAVGMKTCWVARGAALPDTPRPDWTIDTIAGLLDVWSRFST